MQTSMNYLFLLIVIVIGVATGNILSNLIIAKYFSQEFIIQTIKNPVSTPETTPEVIKPVKEDKPKDNSASRETVKLSPNDQVSSEIEPSPLNSEELIEQRKLDRKWNSFSEEM